MPMDHSVCAGLPEKSTYRCIENQKFSTESTSENEKIVARVRGNGRNNYEILEVKTPTRSGSEHRKVFAERY